MRAKYTSDSLSKKIVIINSFDPVFIKARNNKRGLLRELTDSLKNYLAKTIKEQTGDEAILHVTAVFTEVILTPDRFFVKPRR